MLGTVTRVTKLRRALRWLFWMVGAPGVVWIGWPIALVSLYWHFHRLGRLDWALFSDPLFYVFSIIWLAGVGVANGHLCERMFAQFGLPLDQLPGVRRPPPA